MDNTPRFPGGVLSSEAVSGRDRLFILVGISLITAVAWSYLIHISRQMSYDTMMAAMGMTAHPWTSAETFFTFTMWAVMMLGMMSPSAAPVLLLFRSAQAKRGNPGVALSSVTFALGYVAVWTGFSAVAALTQSMLHHAAMLSEVMAASSSHLAGAILIGVGAYQLTPWKNKCLRHCRSPLGFLITNWRDGKLGAWQMGLRHGMYCVACCWALMCVLFVVGVMNLLWVAALTVFVFLEKAGPRGALVARVTGAVLVILGVVVIA